MTKTSRQPTYRLLATADYDIGLVLAADAHRTARQMADQLGQPVTIRDAVTDRLLNTLRPISR